MGMRGLFFALTCIFCICFDPAAAIAAEGQPREPIPAAPALADAVKLIHSTYAKEYADRSVAGRAALAKHLMTTAATPDNSTVGYALLNESQSAANEAGDWTTAISATQEMAKSYDVPAEKVAQMKLAALTFGARGRATSTLGNACLALADTSVESGDNEVAGKASALAAAVAKKAGDAALFTRAASESSRIEHAKAESLAVTAADKKLLKLPDDKAANLASGKWLCFVKADWEQGPPRLAKSSDATLVSAAKADLAGASDAAAMVACGDQWWDYAQAQGGITARGARERAAYWYQQAQPDLKGLSQSKVEERLKEKSAIGDMLVDGGWISADATYKPASQYMGQIQPSPELLNGKEDGRGFAFIADGSKPWIIVDLGRACRITGIEIVNRKVAESQPRAKTVTVWLAATPNGPFNEVWSAAGDAEPRWRIRFDNPLTSQYLKIGLKEPEQFHLLSVKVFGRIVATK